MKAAVLGYGKSGKAAENLLKIKGFENIDIFDSDKSLGYKDISEFKNNYDLICVSPGVDITKHKNIEGNLTSEIELAYDKMDKNADIIAITGTNGKSTTTHLTAHILKAAGYNATACGNIGLPFAEAVLDKKNKIFVIELSSFQIDLLKNFSAKTAAILNVTQDHMDRYQNMENYYNSKLKIMDFIKSDGLFVGDDDDKLIKRSKEFKFKSVFIDKTLKDCPRLEGTRLDFGKFYVDLNAFKLFGRHNILNLVYSLILADKIASFQGDVSNLLISLTGMPHRTELVGEYNGVRYINDSKGTNVDSVVTALQSTQKPSYLLLGGRDKKSDYTVLAPLINSNVSEVCYFGEAAPIIKHQLEKLVKSRQSSFDKLEVALKHCAKVAESGAIVLLSPACTSFDEFKNYEDRGVKFAEYVHKHAGHKL